MSQVNGRELGRKLLDAMRTYVARTVAPVALRLHKLEKDLQGLAREPGPRGEKGDAGKDGRDGRDGRDGAAGRDALEFDILPAIDQEKSYARGTWARHAGGLWRATGDTLGMRGWECVVAGIASIDVEQVEERRFVVKVQASFGDPVVKEFVLPVVLDRGVYRPEAKYAKGDGVTYGGSFWIAQVDEPTLKPRDPTDIDGAQKQWRLAVKKGRDAKGS